MVTEKLKVALVTLKPCLNTPEIVPNRNVPRIFGAYIYLETWVQEQWRLLHTEWVNNWISESTKVQSLGAIVNKQILVSCACFLNMLDHPVWSEPVLTL